MYFLRYLSYNISRLFTLALMWSTAKLAGLNAFSELPKQVQGSLLCKLIQDCFRMVNLVRNRLQPVDKTLPSAREV